MLFVVRRRQRNPVYNDGLIARLFFINIHLFLLLDLHDHRVFFRVRHHNRQTLPCPGREHCSPFGFVLDISSFNSSSKHRTFSIIRLFYDFWIYRSILLIILANISWIFSLVLADTSQQSNPKASANYWTGRSAGTSLFFSRSFLLPTSAKTISSMITF